MIVAFEKFQGAGNDFIVLDNREGLYPQISKEYIASLTDRKFGIGADGLILINACSENDFEMDFYNPDGSKSFCGNGARCAVAFAQKKGFTLSKQRFNAVDGLHDYRFEGDNIAVKMNDVAEVLHLDDFTGFVHTGSPHYIQQSDDLSTENVLRVGKQVRFSEPYLREGVNVNLVLSKQADFLEIATYERGVENETLSCGTGATACALYVADLQYLSGDFLNVKTKGGDLRIYFEKSQNQGFQNVWLSGPATFVFSGNIVL